MWERKTLSFATDPVAMDRLGWAVIDAKREELGLPPVGESKWQGASFRQPEHIYFAGALGLGESDRAKIEQILQKTSASHYGVRSILNELIQSELFLSK